jgi:hypothetical protein
MDSLQSIRVLFADLEEVFPISTCFCLHFASSFNTRETEDVEIVFANCCMANAAKSLLVKDLPLLCHS